MDTESSWETQLKQIEVAVAEGRAFPIVPEERLYLHCDGEPRGQQFAELFRQVWQAIPADAHVVIRDFWRRHALFGKPFIEYSNQWLPGGSDVRATTKAFAGEMQFLAKELDPMPDDAVRFIIAHELAHVFQKARGDTLDFSERGEAAFLGADGERRTVDENEENADRLAKSWGFPQVPLMLWDIKSRRRSLGTTNQDFLE
jgi:hypothetical protein